MNDSCFALTSYKTNGATERLNNMKSVTAHTLPGVKRHAFVLMILCVHEHMCPSLYVR